ncbi:hypothetical protein V6N13_051133 [Hibiscus sabdariffa]
MRSRRGDLTYQLVDTNGPLVEMTSCTIPIVLSPLATQSVIEIVDINNNIFGVIHSCWQRSVPTRSSDPLYGDIGGYSRLFDDGNTRFNINRLDHNLI